MAPPPPYFNIETRLSMNSREAISVRKCAPPFLTQVSVSLRVDSCIFGFLFPIRFFSDRMASLGWTVFDRIRSETSKLIAISSRELDVARSICSSRADVPDENQPAILVFECSLDQGQLRVGEKFLQSREEE